MKRYMIERRFTQGLTIPLNDEGESTIATVIANNAECGVTWLHSYVSPDRTATFCVYDGPSQEAVREAADCNGLPITQITEVRVLDPYFYRP